MNNVISIYGQKLLGMYPPERNLLARSGTVSAATDFSVMFLFMFVSRTLLMDSVFRSLQPLVFVLNASSELELPRIFKRFSSWFHLFTGSSGYESIRSLQSQCDRADFSADRWKKQTILFSMRGAIFGPRRIGAKSISVRAGAAS